MRNRPITFAASFVFLTVLALTIPIQSGGAEAATCNDGFQARGDVCVSQRMSDYIACLEASGGNKEEIETEFTSAVKDSIKSEAKAAGRGVVIRADGSIELDKNAEQSIFGKMKTKFYVGALAACEKVLPLSTIVKPDVRWVQEGGLLQLVN